MEPAPREAECARGAFLSAAKRRIWRREQMSKCELCELRDYTQRYASFVHPFKFTILDCDSCDTPMAVLGDHRQSPTEEERAFMTEALSMVARQKYGADKFVIDGVMRQIPDHCHIHARPIRRFDW
jgi:hypothetical protein